MRTTRHQGEGRLSEEERRRKELQDLFRSRERERDIDRGR